MSTHESSLHAADVRALPGPRRVDRLRGALRSGRFDPTRVAAELDAWISLFRSNPDPALRVLVLELLDHVDDPRADALAERALGDRGDGVRLEALHRLLTRHPERTDELSRKHLDDEGVEVRLLAVARLHPIDPGAAIDALFDGLRAEIGGPREAHVLERTVEFLVDDVAATHALGRLRALRAEVNDDEGMVAWAIERLEELS